MAKRYVRGLDEPRCGICSWWMKQVPESPGCRYCELSGIAHGAGDSPCKMFYRFQVNYRRPGAAPKSHAVERAGATTASGRQGGLLR